MEIAVFSDIHGNYVAFQACLACARKRNINTFIFLGDYLGEFPYPQRTMEILYRLQETHTCFFIRGNKEDYWIDRTYNERCEWRHGDRTVGALHYSYRGQTEKDLHFWESLPVCREISFANMPPLWACHRPPGEDCPHRYILFGHTHLQNAYRSAGRLFLNPGAVGVPLHSNGKTQFMILRSNGQEWQYEPISLDYDRDRVIREIRESGLEEEAPYWSRVTKHLLSTGAISHGTVLTQAMALCEEAGKSCSWYNIPEEYWKAALAELIER